MMTTSKASRFARTPRYASYHTPVATTYYVLLWEVLYDIQAFFALYFLWILKKDLIFALDIASYNVSTMR